MAIERERKFLVDWQKLPGSIFDRGMVRDCKEIHTGYFTKDGVAIRVSVRDLGQPTEKCKVCFKSPGGSLEREEYEYTIPTSDALSLLNLAPTRIKKDRFDLDGWEIDHLTINVSDEPGVPVLTDMWMAEWEETPGKQPFPETLPDWSSVEVTTDPDYSNQALAWKYGRREFERRRGTLIPS